MGWKTGAGSGRMSRNRLGRTRSLWGLCLAIGTCMSSSAVLECTGMPASVSGVCRDVVGVKGSSGVDTRHHFRPGHNACALLRALERCFRYFWQRPSCLRSALSWENDLSRKASLTEFGGWVHVTATPGLVNLVPAWRAGGILTMYSRQRVQL